MPNPPYRRSPGVPARLLRDVENLSQQTGSGDLGTSQTGGGLQILDSRTDPIWAVIDSQPDAGLNAYGFTRVDDGTGDGTYPDLAGTTETSDGDTLSGDLVAWEVNGRTDVATDGTVKVLLHPNRLGRGYTFTAPTTQYTPPDPSTGTAVSAGWLAGLTEDDCLALTVLGASGRCSDIDTEQVLTLVFDTDKWASGSDFTHDSGAGPAEFSITADGVPKLVIDGVAGVFDGAGAIDGVPYADWAFGGTTLCDGEHGTCGGNIFRVRLKCVSCLCAGWGVPTESGTDCASTVLLPSLGVWYGYHANATMRWVKWAVSPSTAYHVEAEYQVGIMAAGAVYQGPGTPDCSGTVGIGPVPPVPLCTGFTTNSDTAFVWFFLSSLAGTGCVKFRLTAGACP